LDKKQPIHRKKIMSIGTILLIVLILLLIGAFPSWPHSKSWGYGPSGGLGLVVVILLILVLTGRI
jgi:hypothetical protein